MLATTILHQCQSRLVGGSVGAKPVSSRLKVPLRFRYRFLALLFFVSSSFSERGMLRV